MTNWSTLILKAEKLLGGSAPFVNLASLLTFKTNVVGAKVRRLAATVDHPFFSTVRASFPKKTLLHSFERPLGGLIIMLFGQLYLHSNYSSTKLSAQHRNLAGVFETVHLALAIHKSLVDIEICSNNKKIEEVNKLATLSGDLLFANVSKSLAKLHHAKIMDRISESIENMIEAEFYPIRHKWTPMSESESLCDTSRHILCLNKPVKPHTHKWLSYVTLSRGSLLGSCCEACLLLVQAELSDKLLFLNSDQIYFAAKQFGVYWACLSRLMEELEHFKRNLSKNQLISNPPYKEYGLIEPTLADAYFSEHKLNPTEMKEMSDSLLKEHKKVGLLLSNRLRESLDRLLSVDDSVNSLPNTQILVQMVNKLVLESEEFCLN